MASQPTWMADDSQQQFAPPNAGAYNPPGPGLQNGQKSDNSPMIKLGVKILIIGASVMMVVHGKPYPPSPPSSLLEWSLFL